MKFRICFKGDDPTYCTVCYVVLELLVSMTSVIQSTVKSSQCSKSWLPSEFTIAFQRHDMIFSMSKLKINGKSKIKSFWSFKPKVTRNLPFVCFFQFLVS